MSPTLRIVILAVIGVALFFIGLAVGLTADLSQSSPPEVIQVEVAADCDENQCKQADPGVVLLPVRVPVPFAVADEAIGAYRVNGFLSFRGPGKFSTHRAVMACFPGNY